MEHATVVFLAANPLQGQPLLLGEEFRAIEDKIRGARFRDRITLLARWAARPCDWLETMTDHAPSVLHFSGHGGGEQGLCLQLGDGSPIGVNVDGLTEAMRAEGSTVKLVVLNACFSEVQARALISQVPCVIGMPDVIGDRAAIEYAASFYRALASGRSVATAHRHGMAALKLHRSNTMFRDVMASSDECGPSMPVPTLLTRADTDAEHVYLVHAPDRSEPPLAPAAHATQDAGCILTIRATLTEFDEHVFARVTAELRRLSKDMTVEIIKIEEGSVRLTLRLSPAGAKALLEQRASGDLTSICGFEIESVIESPAALTGAGTAVAEAAEPRAVTKRRAVLHRRRASFNEQLLVAQQGAAAAAGDPVPRWKILDDRNDFEYLHLTFGAIEPSLRRYARRLCRNDADADDLVQETFLRAMHLQIPPPAETRAWLLRILNNLRLDQLRKRARNASPVAEIGDTSPPDPPEEPAWSSLTIEDVRDALRAIDPLPREVYTLHAIEGRSYTEIADLLSIPRVTVGTRLHRARKQLREILVKRTRLADSD